MNAMIDNSLLKRYLAGEASDDEVQQCEAYLGDPANQDEASRESEFDPLPDDSLVETLRHLGGQTVELDVDSNSANLVERIQSLVPSQSIGPDELDRILSPPESDDEIGRIGQYRVIEFIAGGGMGLVFKAEDVGLQRLVCIKVLHPMLAASADSKARFAREAKAAAKLRNARITTVLDVGEHRELPFLVMELLDGQSLRDKLNSEGPLEPETARKLTVQIAEGLRYAHRLGYLHRDIKPENIWVTPESDIKLLDFGLARAVDESTNLTNTGTILGTPSYMSPEQVQGKELDARSDLFSVGSVLFEMLTGDSPFGKSNLFSTMMSVANDSLEFPKDSAPNAVPSQLMSILETLLKKSPEDRLASADALIAALEGTEEPDGFAKQAHQGSGINRGWIGLTGGLAGAACVAFALFLIQLNDKGTLIVEADPSVSVSIANEKVSIHDPKTGKDFKVTIGDHPLPSGVYQLEMIDDSGQYTLSSDVIVIRRGEKQIVRVELKPIVPNAIAPNAIAPKEMNTPEKEPILTLAEIPTLNANELQRKLNLQPDQPLLRNSIVTSPARRQGITSWSIEIPLFDWQNIRLNADGTRIATMSRHENKVAIWDHNGNLVHLIPAQGEVKQILWSPEPNVIAVVENGSLRKQVTVWKLFDGHVEAIDVIPADTTKVAWSWNGMTLALQGDSQVSFIDLAKGSIYAHPNFGITGEISQQPWSLNGRYFAATVGDSVKVWDLEERKLLHIFASSAGGRFLPVGNQIAIFKANKWEIWDLDSFERQRLIEPDERWLAYWPDQRFEKLAAITADQTLVVKDVRAGTQTESKLELDIDLNLNGNTAKSWLRSAKFNWSARGRNFMCTVVNQVIMSIPQSDQDADRNGKVRLALLRPFSRVYAPLGLGSQQRLSVNNRMVYHNEFGEERPGAVSSFDLNTVTKFPQSQFSFFNAGAIYCLSPDGKSIAIVGSDDSLRNQKELSPAERQIVSQKWSKDLRQIRICSVETGELLKTVPVERQVQGLFWSADSKALVVSWIESITQDKTSEREREEYRRRALSIIQQYDRDDDGKLSTAQLKSMRGLGNIDADQNGDDLISADELYLAYLKRSKNIHRFNQLAVKIVDVATGRETRLKPGTKSPESGRVPLGFQQNLRGSSWQFAKPILYNNKITVPLFDSSTFQNGHRSYDYRGLREYKDKIGIFDIQTGELVEIIELNEQFEGARFAITDDMIMIGRRSTPTNSTVDSYFIFDRRNGNKSFVPARSNSPSELPVIGMPYLSPAFPLVAISTAKNGLQVWKLDSKAETLTKVKALGNDSEISYAGPKMMWHPTEPTVAWISGRDRTVNWYNVEMDQLTTNDSVAVNPDVTATPDGWLVSGSQRMVEFDRSLKVKKTYLPTQRTNPDSAAGEFDQGITAAGVILQPERKNGLHAIQLRDNRIETLTIEEFERQLH